MSPLTIISEDTEFVIWKEKYTAGDFVKLRNHLLLSLGRGCKEEYGIQGNMKSRKSVDKMAWAKG